MLPLAWSTCADICVDELDKKYVEAMYALKQEFKRMYPKAPLTTEIIADKLIENRIGKEGYGTTIQRRSRFNLYTYHKHET